MKLKVNNTAKTKAIGEYELGMTSASGTTRGHRPYVVRGEPAVCKMLCQTLRWQSKYISGVLAFPAGDQLSLEWETAVLDFVEAALGSGLEKDSLSWLWIRHLDKANHELHFAVPTIELHSGERVVPYVGSRDRQFLQTVENLINIFTGSASPLDPEHMRWVYPNYRQVFAANREKCRDFYHVVSSLIPPGKKGLSVGIESRSSLEALLKANSVLIERRTSKSIYVKWGGLSVELGGLMCVAEFTSPSFLEREYRQRSNKFRDASSHSFQIKQFNLGFRFRSELFAYQLKRASKVRKEIESALQVLDNLMIRRLYERNNRKRTAGASERNPVVEVGLGGTIQASTNVETYVPAYRVLRDENPSNQSKPGEFAKRATEIVSSIADIIEQRNGLLDLLARRRKDRRKAAASHVSEPQPETKIKTLEQPPISRPEDPWIS